MWTFLFIEPCQHFVCIYLSIYLSVCPSVRRSVCLPVWLSICPSFRIRVCILLSIKLSVRTLHGCMDVWMYGCMDVWMYGCMDVSMYGCMDVWMYVCMQCQKNTPKAATLRTVPLTSTKIWKRCKVLRARPIQSMRNLRKTTCPKKHLSKKLHSFSFISLRWSCQSLRTFIDFIRPHRGPFALSPSTNLEGIAPSVTLALSALRTTWWTKSHHRTRKKSQAWSFALVSLNQSEPSQSFFSQWNKIVPIEIFQYVIHEQEHKSIHKKRKMSTGLSWNLMFYSVFFHCKLR